MSVERANAEPGDRLGRRLTAAKVQRRPSGPAAPGLTGTSSVRRASIEGLYHGSPVAGHPAYWACGDSAPLLRPLALLGRDVHVRMLEPRAAPIAIGDCMGSANACVGGMVGSGSGSPTDDGGSASDLDAGDEGSNDEASSDAGAGLGQSCGLIVYSANRLPNVHREWVLGAKRRCAPPIQTARSICSACRPASRATPSAPPTARCRTRSASIAHARSSYVFKTNAAQLASDRSRCSRSGIVGSARAARRCSLACIPAPAQCTRSAPWRCEPARCPGSPPFARPRRSGGQPWLEPR